MQSTKEKLYTFLVSLFCLTLVFGNIIGAKWIAVPFLQEGIPAGLLSYPVTFIILGLVSEVYGKKAAQWMVFMGFSFSAAFFLLINLMIHLPDAATMPTKEALVQIFSFNAASLICSLIALALCQIVSTLLFQWLKTISKGKFFLFRSLGTTAVSQALDTIISNSILFGFFFPSTWAFIVFLTLSSYLLKMIFAVASLPLLHLSVKGTKRYFLNTHEAK